MKKRSTTSSVWEVNANAIENGVDDSQLQLQPSSSAVAELPKEKQEETLVPPNPNPNPNLADGFYEIETIRRKRVRKGQLQYLIKWRGWPETANTWEPLQNLQSVPDLIDAFEESLKSGKHRKRKRKHVVHHTQLKKRFERSTTAYSLRHFPTPLSADQGLTNADPTTLAKPLLTNADENEYDPKLSELKATANTGVEVDNLAIHFQQPRVSTANGHVDGQPQVDYVEPTQSGRCRGAKRRKSGSVKRFKRETDPCKLVDAQNGVAMPAGAACMGYNSPMKMGDAKTACNIVKIIKPIGYSASLSDNMQDVLVTFMAMRFVTLLTTPNFIVTLAHLRRKL
uniref:Chromo domain protein LHP1 n=1 Tax=Cajanus cajan TaxID=3821 RepID=A0A151SFL2_CAJCA|nr:Chromo domain protein LHP1 [Cajanus cajan]